MKNIYQTISKHEGSFEDVLDKLKLQDVFNPIIKKFDQPTASSIIRYIAYLYSRDSEYVLLKDSTTKMKMRAADAAKIPADLRSQVMDFTPRNEEDDVPDIIQTAAGKYIHFQKDRDTRDLMSLYALYDEMLRASSAPAENFEQREEKFKCRKMANEIKGWMEEQESRMTAEDSDFKAIRQELGARYKSTSTSLRAENAANVS